MNLHKRYPKLCERMASYGIVPSGSAGYFLGDLNYILTPIGFRRIEETEVMSAVMDEIERFLVGLNKHGR